MHREFESSGPWCPICQESETDYLLTKAEEILCQYFLDSEGWELVALIRAHIKRHEPKG